jgi:hypothetical protein
MVTGISMEQIKHRITPIGRRKGWIFGENDCVGSFPAKGLRVKGADNFGDSCGRRVFRCQHGPRSRKIKQGQHSSNNQRTKN